MMNNSIVHQPPTQQQQQSTRKSKLNKTRIHDSHDEQSSSVSPNNSNKPKRINPFRLPPRYTDESPCMTSKTSSLISFASHSRKEKKIIFNTDTSDMDFSSLKMPQSHLTPQNIQCLRQPTFHTTPASHSNTSSIYTITNTHKRPSSNLPPTTSRCPNEDELEDKSDTGLSPPNSNVTVRTNLEQWLTPQNRDSKSLWTWGN